MQYRTGAEAIVEAQNGEAYARAQVELTAQMGFIRRDAGRTEHALEDFEDALLCAEQMGYEDLVTKLREIISLEKLRLAAAATRAEYDRRLEAQELTPGRMEVSYLFYLMEAGEPVKRADLKGQAIVLSREELQQLGGLEVVFASGEVECIEPDSASWFGLDDRLIIFPDDLGE